MWNRYRRRDRSNLEEQQEMKLFLLGELARVLETALCTEYTHSGGGR